MAEIQKIKRTINYYELSFDYTPDFQLEKCDHFLEVFESIAALVKTRAKVRYQTNGEKSIFIQDIHIDNTNLLITGKLRCVRKDLLPEIMNTQTDVAKGIEAKDEEGLVETTHFVIDFSKKIKKLALEFNQFGSKITDFALYIQNIGVYKKYLKAAGFRPIVKDDLAKIKDRINRCSEFTVKVHKDNVPKIRALDNKVYSVLKLSIDQFKSDYATLTLKFDYKQRQETAEINQSILNLITNLVKDKTKVELFNHLSLRAEDGEKNDLLENFDLLIDKVKSEVSVEKKKRYKTIISTDMFAKMKLEMVNNNI